LTSLELLNVFENKIARFPTSNILSPMTKLKEILVGGNFLDIAASEVDVELYKKMSGVNDMWIPSFIDEGLYLGSYTAAKNREFLQERSITHVLIVGSGLQALHKDICEYKIINIQDIETEDITEHLVAIIDFIENVVQKKSNVLVHCAAGVSRSGSAVIAYIMHKYKLNYNDARQRVAKRRPCVSPNTGFEKQLIAFEKRCS